MMIEPEHSPALAERNPAPFRASLLATSTIPALGMTFRRAADRVRELVEHANNSPRGEDDGIEDKAELERREAARDADCQEWRRIEDAMMTTPAQTIGDLFAKLERITCPSIGIRTMEPSDAEVMMLEDDVKRLQPLLTGSDLSEPTDSPIFAAFDRWADLVRDCCAAKADDDVEHLSEQADEAALNVMAHEPTTRDGLAAQVYVAFHLEHGGTAADHLDIDFAPLTGGDGPDNAAVHALADRIKRLGRRHGGETDVLHRHVTLEEAADRRAGAYQLPEEVSQAMQAACARNRAATAAEDAREPDQAQGQREEALSRFRALKPERRETFLSFMRFLPVSSHLHSAMLDFAHKHGMTWEYRRWMEDHLADIPAEQGGANDQRQEADPFADTIAAFEAEAPATLALPLEPTGRMVDAGSSAAGITPAQFQAAYAAAVEALKLERAA
ncbi:hypothetical protein [Azospirillum sp. B2RO_4]|uniref:hypothetical protein n=1 Tax=Azospirillum sp. B2RO_4 TaxID=3027796 RepID=UPI003DA9F378